MKKLKTFFLICSILLTLSLGSIYSTEYTIETSRGPQLVVIPEGTSELEAFLRMSKLYLEERFDHEDLLESIDPLKKSIETYKDNYEKLDSLYKTAIKDRDDLLDLLKEKNKIKIVKPSFGISATLNETFSFDAGIILLEKVQVSTILSYPYSIGIRIGVVL